eukprot:GHVU01019319.1.p1 GENE.GHVU01019319.1~~GHVU01019319.1.p1  ORF type:complete len:276 (+),score=28.71 GHVU01019319.1:825-1652(+)
MRCARWMQGHKGLVNVVDALGGHSDATGPPEVVSGGADGAVMLWDMRKKGPAVSLLPNAGVTQSSSSSDSPPSHSVDSGGTTPNCWAAALGNSHTDSDRCIASGYDNGDVKLFDLRMSRLLWEVNVQNGVCGLDFDRPDIRMNKLCASTLQGYVVLFDMRTYHPEMGYASMTHSVHSATVWACNYLPQNREVFATTGGNGQVCIFKYAYPQQRSVKDSEGIAKGVTGSLELLNEQSVSTQPLVALDWHPDKIGLACTAALDQTLRVLLVTKLNLY